MISKLFLVTMLTFPLMNSQIAHASSINCSIVKTQHRELGEVIHPEMMGNLYARGMLKIAVKVAEENFSTFEDAAKDILQSEDDKSLAALKNRSKNFNYWQKNRRIPNADFATVASIMAKLTAEELGAINLVYLANKNEGRVSFSEVIYKLISKSEGTVVVTTPQLVQAMADYPTSCLQQVFVKKQAANLINKMNMAVAENLDDVVVLEDGVRLGSRSLIQLPKLSVAKKKYNEDSIDSLHIGQRLLSEVGGSFNSYRDSNAVIHGVSNIETIKHFHKFYGLSDFAVLNKKEGTVSIFDDSARLIKNQCRHFIGK